MRANLTGASLFKGLVESRTMPSTADSPEISEDEEHSFEDNAVEPSRFMYESDEDRGWAGEDEEAGSCGESFVISVAWLALP